MTISRRSPMSVLTSPWAVPGGAVLGLLLGIYVPGSGAVLAPLGSIYIGLLKMIVLPLILSSLVFSLRSMVHDPESLRYLARMAVWVAAFSLFAVAVAGTLAVLVKPGELHDPAERVELGRVISHGDKIATDLQMQLFETAEKPADNILLKSLLGMVPNNVFEALASGDTIKVLVFAVLFGMAMGRVPDAVSRSMSDSLDATYRACLVLTRWLNLLLPLAIVAMLASQASTISVGSLLLMSKFLLVLCGSAVILVTGSLILIAAVTRRGLREVLRAHQDVLLMAVTTRSTVACIPSLIDILSHQLRLHRGLIEVMVPLLMMVLRVGAIMMYVVGVVFIAQLHDRVLGLDSLLLVGCASVMVAMTTIGSSGIGVVWQMAIICGYLALPFEAAFPLFVAVETVSDTLRTVVVVASVSGVTAAIAPAEVAGQGDLQTVAAGVTQVG